MTKILLNSTDAQAQAMMLLMDTPLDGTKTFVLTDKKESRSAAQHRLKWIWMNQLEKQLVGFGKGKDSLQWNRYFKVRFMKDLLIAQDSAYVDFFDKLGALYRSALKGRDTDDFREFAEIVIGDQIKTEWLTVKSMSEFMNRIDSYALDNLSVRLITPSDLRWSIV